MRSPLLLVAAGGLARETLEAARAGGDEVLGLVDEDESRWGTALDGTSIIGGLDEVRRLGGTGVVICAGRGGARRSLVRRLAAIGTDEERYISVVHPSVHIPSSCTIGAGSIVLAGVVLTASVRIGRHVVVMPNATLTHDDVLEDYVTAAAGVNLGGGVRVEEAAYLGMSSSVREGLVVGANSVLGMGATLVRSLPADETWVGTPAEPLALRGGLASA